MASMHFLFLIALFYIIYFSLKVKADCGGLIEKTSGTITSPLYPYDYPQNQTCTWEIKMPPNNRIGLHFKHFHLEFVNDCQYDFVDLKSKMENGSVQELGKFCGTERIPNKISESNILLIEFKSDHITQFTGFEMEFFNVLPECGGRIEISKGSIVSPQYPREYLPNKNCTWNIQAPLNHIIKLKFTEFQLEEHDTCFLDHVIVKSMMENGEIRGHGTFCGAKIPPVIVSESNTLLIQLVSNGFVQHKGFMAEFMSEECGGLIEGGKGMISSLFFPHPYPSYKLCEWSFLVPPQHKIKLHFLHFEIEGGEGCPNDFLQVQSQSEDGSIHEYGKYCGVLKPPLITSRENLFLKFVSDRSFQGKGFEAKYSIEQLTDFKSSISLTRSTPVFEPLDSTVVNQYDDTTVELVMSRNDENTSSDKYQSTISQAGASSTSTHSPNKSTTNKRKTKRTENGITKSADNILSALKLLIEKVASIEERHKIFFNSIEDIIIKGSNKNIDTIKNPE